MQEWTDAPRFQRWWDCGLAQSLPPCSNSTEKHSDNCKQSDYCSRVKRRRTHLAHTFPYPNCNIISWFHSQSHWPSYTYHPRPMLTMLKSEMLVQGQRPWLPFSMYSQPYRNGLCQANTQDPRSVYSLKRLVNCQRISAGFTPSWKRNSIIVRSVTGISTYCTDIVTTDWINE